jgi:hypothetical protein
VSFRFEDALKVMAYIILFGGIIGALIIAFGWPELFSHALVLALSAVLSYLFLRVIGEISTTLKIILLKMEDMS